jgi:hypothetical protein
MKKTILAFSLGLVLLAQASQVHALSCLPVDMYLDTVLTPEDGTFVFKGTATPMTADHTQVVTITEAVKGWVPSKMWVTHNYSDDWKYFCSNGPAKVGEPTLFFATVDDYGTWQVVQTLPLTDTIAKTFLKEAADEDLEGGITEATAKARRDEMIDSIQTLIKKVMAMITELKYWETQAK